MSKRQISKSSEVFSIFGQCEAVAADIMIERHGLYRIPASEIPATAAVNDVGTPARFAVVVPARLVPEFNRLCAEMRS